MRKVDPALIPELLKGSENQRPGWQPDATHRKAIESTGYKKGHDLAEGFYLVKLVGIKCHGPYCYYMDLEVLQDALSVKAFPEPKVIKGYGERKGSDFSDLAACFGSGVVHKRSAGYVGGYGVVWLTHSGWIQLLSRDDLGVLLPGFRSEKFESSYSKITIESSFSQYRFPNS